MGGCKEQHKYNMQRYLAGEMNDSEMERFEEHYLQCETCFNELSALQETQERTWQLTRRIIRQEKEHALPLARDYIDSREDNHPFNISRIIKQLARRWAAWSTQNQYANLAFSAILLLLLGTAAPDIYVYSKYSDNFNRSLLLDDLTFEPDRSNSTLISYSPVNDSEIDETSTFTWKLRNPQSATLTIYDNEKNVIFATEVDTSSFQLLELPDPGLYYWELSVNQKTLHLGSFFIDKPFFL